MGPLILATPSGPNCTRLAKKGKPGTTCKHTNTHIHVQQHGVEGSVSISLQQRCVGACNRCV